MLKFVEGFLSGMASDVCEYTNVNVVTIKSPNRLYDGDPDKVATVSAPITGPLSITASPSWQDMQGAPGLGQLFNAANDLSTAFLGKSLQQPWMYRQYWKGTPPIEFSVTLAFVATTNAENEVFKPCQKLIGFCYPRNKNPSARDAGIMSTYIPPGPNLYTGMNKDGKVTVNALGIGDGFEADYIQFSYGKMITLNICYLQSVSVEFSQTLDPSGFPHAAKATCSIRSFDAGVWWEGNGFSLTQTDFNHVNLTDMIKETTTDAANSIKEQVGLKKPDETTNLGVK